jgi:hypothetical protein
MGHGDGVLCEGAMLLVGRMLAGQLFWCADPRSFHNGTWGRWMIVLALLLLGGAIAGVYLYFGQYCNKLGPVKV